MSSPPVEATPSSSEPATATTNPTAINWRLEAFQDTEQPTQHVRYTLNEGAGHGALLPEPSEPPNPSSNSITRSDSAVTSTRSTSFPIRRRSTRAGSFKPVQNYEDFESRPGWQPGAEPGVDPTKPDGGHAARPTLSAPCEISIVDFSQEAMSMQRFDNDSLVPFLKLPQPAQAKCRWINVKGLSWDVIQALGQYKKLHKLAIEDIMNTRNRTKVDWYRSSIPK